VEVAASTAPVVQRKLIVGPAGDHYEREADAVAAQVVQRLRTQGASSGASGVQRLREPSMGVVEPGHGPQGGPASADVEQRIGAAGGGSALDPTVRREMESGFGADFGGVRIHNDGAAAELSASLQARAFTKGSDIFFGEGQYQPGSPGGQTLLAHELTHVVQQSGGGGGGGGVQRSMAISRDTAGEVRRWDLTKPIDVSGTTKIETIKSGQAVFMVTDGSNDTIVIKAEKEPVNLMKLATLVHSTVHDTDVIDSKDIDNSEKTKFLNMLVDPNLAVGPNWAVVGASWKAWNKDGADDATHGRRGHQIQVGGLPLQAQKLAKGKDAKELAKDTGKSGLKSYLESPAWMKKLGAATVADIMTGNADRMTGGNLGNWMTSADGKVALIDNIDGNANSSMKDLANVFPTDLKNWGADPKAFFANSINTLIDRATDESKGAMDYKTWADEPGTLRRQFMIQDFTAGFEETRKKIVSKFADNKSSKEGRQLKKDVKATAADDQLDPWEVLKARARYLKNPKNAESLQKTLNKRQGQRARDIKDD
jgi:hypothetical protein